jgi:hypothetical protein
MAKTNTDTLRNWISLGLLTIGVIIIVMGAIRAFGVPVFQILFGNAILEEQAPALIGLGTAFTFVSFWLQQKPFTRIKKGLGF